MRRAPADGEVRLSTDELLARIAGLAATRHIESGKRLAMILALLRKQRIIPATLESMDIHELTMTLSQVSKRLNNVLESLAGAVSIAKCKNRPMCEIQFRRADGACDCDAGGMAAGVAPTPRKKKDGDGPRT